MLSSSSGVFVEKISFAISISSDGVNFAFSSSFFKSLSFI